MKSAFCYNFRPISALAGPTKLTGSTSRYKKSHIFWDLDNCQPSDLQQTLVCTGRLLRSVQHIAGTTPSFSAYANRHTLRRLAPDSQHVLDGALRCLGGSLVAVQNRSQSADLAMRSDMYEYTKDADHACIVCISNDQGFAPTMRYAASLGFLTICICRPGKKTPSWPRPYITGFGKHPLCSACHLTVVWSFRSSLDSMDSAERAVVATSEGSAFGSTHYQQRLLELAPSLMPHAVDCNPGVSSAVFKDGDASNARSPSRYSQAGAGASVRSGTSCLAGLPEVARRIAVANAAVVWVNTDVQPPG